MGTAPAFASASEAMDMVHAGLAFLASADATALGAEVRARLLRDLEQADSVATAARTVVLGAFGASQDYTDDGDYSPFSWLLHRTQVTKGTAGDHTAWIKRGAGHPLVLAALATRKVSTSYAREICWWTGKLPEDSRAAADEILLAAAASGLELPDLAGLAAEMYERSRQHKPDTDPGDPGSGAGSTGGDGDPDPAQDQPPLLDDRVLRVSTTLGGAGIIRGALTPECAEFVQTVLDALSRPAGADDDRTQDQRYHDALEEAMRRLIAGGLVPARSGQPLRVWVYISLADLMAMDGSAELAREWMEQLRARWAGQRAAAAEAGGHAGLWLDGDAAQAIACGAPVAPVVVGEVDPAAFGDLIRLCAQLDRLLHGDAGPEMLAAPGDGDPEDPAGTGSGTPDAPDAASPGTAPDAEAGADVPAGFSRDRSREALEQAIIAQAAELLSGPGGLASFLRRRALGGRLGGPSLPLDIGYARTVPPGIRNAARLRRRGCEWPGGCHQPAGACQVHHVKHLADGGETSLTGCIMLCFFHHQIMVHQRGWTLVVNPDGTTTAWNKDKTRTLHSHGPPARTG